MTDSKKRRMSMLDSLATAGAATPAPSGMMAGNRALRSARTVVDNHHVWEIEPQLIDDTRIADRLDAGDIADLRNAIETNGQTVPILVRRNPTNPERYLLVYGRRRLEAIRSSSTLTTVRALVTTMDDAVAVQSQISENMARRDLSYIEKALFAQELVRSGFGNQTRVAEVLTVTKSAVSMAISLVDIIGRDLIEAIGAAHGIGRPRWDALGKGILAADIDRTELTRIANTAYAEASTEESGKADPDLGVTPSIAAFEAVAGAVEKAQSRSPAPTRKASEKRPLTLAGQHSGSIRRTPNGVAIDLASGPFSDWVDTHAEDLMEELHARWTKRAEE